MQLPNPGIEPTSFVSPAFTDGSFTTEPHGKPYYLYFWPTSYRPKAPRTFSLSLINLLAHRTQRKRLLIYCKRTQRRKSQMVEIHRVRYWERAQSFYVLSKALYPNLHFFTNLEALQAPSFWIFVWCVLVTCHVQLCDPMHCSPPGSSVYGILQARILE